MSVKPNLYSYVLARDHGFAPNPFFGYCTLANCKPEIRDAAKIGDWVIGTSSQKSHKKNNYLVYYMRVTDFLSFDDYWESYEFQNKKPDFYNTTKYAYGDNIYHHDENGNWCQEFSHHNHNLNGICKENLDNDTQINKVLISKHFGYFGENPKEIPYYLLEPSVLLDYNIPDAIRSELEKFKSKGKLHGIVKAGQKYKCAFPNCLIEMTIKWLDTLPQGKSANPAKWRRKT